MFDINKVTLKNNAMFNIVMRRPNLCKMCLERILGKTITDINYPDLGKNTIGKNPFQGGHSPQCANIPNSFLYPEVV